jgi:hypothetical protein
MSARTIRTVFAAPFVMTIACSKSEPAHEQPAAKPKPPAPALRLFEINAEHTEACVAREICPPGPGCTPAKSYAFPCNRQGRYQTINNKDIPLGESIYAPQEMEYDHRDEIAKLADGTCRSREESCTALGCLGGPTPCPPDHGIAMPPRGWTITRSGTRCTAQPLPVTSASHTDEAVAYTCPSDPEVTGVRQSYNHKCEIDNHVGDPPVPRNPGSTFNPPEPRYIECPPGAKDPRPPGE